MAKKNGGKGKVNSGLDKSITGDKRGKGENVVGSVEVEDGSDSEDNSDTEVSSEEEEVIGEAGTWSSATKKGRKAKQVVYICDGGRKKCGKVIQRNEKCIFCECCGKWFHIKCQELCVEAVNVLVAYKLPWVCGSCRRDLKLKRTLESKIDGCIETKMKEIEKVIKVQIEESEKRLTQKFTACKQQSASEFDKRIEEGLKNVETNVTKEIGRRSDKVMKAVAEQERKVDRSHNIIMHNIPEHEGGSATEKREHDLLMIKKITEGICGKENELKVERAIRLQGREERDSERQSRPRLLLVRFEKKEHADLVLSNRFGMREAGFKNMYINKDLSKEQREQEWKLRAELKEKGKDTHMIFRGRVIPRNRE